MTAPAPGTTGTPVNPPGAPLIAVCVRHTDQRPATDPLTGAIHPRPRLASASPAELAAVELALRIAAAWGGQVLAVTAGPPAAEATLREIAAAGAQVLRVDVPGDWPGGDRPGGEGAGWGRAGAGQARAGWLDDGRAGEDYAAALATDERALAGVLAGVLRPRRPAFVLCGDRSADRGSGALPAFLAHELGAAQALGLTGLSVTGLAGASQAGASQAGPGPELAGQRRLPGGRRERLLIRPPAVCSVEAAGVRLRRAPLPAVLAARHAEIPVIVAGMVSGLPGAARSPAVPPGPVVRTGPPRPYRPRTHAVPAAPVGSPRERLLALASVLAAHEPPAVVAPVSPAAAAQALLAYLRRAGCAVPAGAGTDGSP